MVIYLDLDEGDGHLDFHIEFINELSGTKIKKIELNNGAKLNDN